MKIDAAAHLGDASPWRAEKDPIRLAILGKLAEELGELQAAIARCIIQGVDGYHPATRKANIEWLAEEAIDVENMLNFLNVYITEAPKNIEMFEARLARKQTHIAQWLASFDEEIAGAGGLK